MQNKNYFKMGLLFLIIFILLIPTSSSSLIESKYDILTYNNFKSCVNPKIQEILEKINETLVLGFLKELVEIGPRKTGTYGAQAAAEYIKEQFEKMQINSEFHNWESFGNQYNPRYFKCKNVIGTQYGVGEEKDEVIIFNAHYDTVTNTVGANDDGSGTAAILAAAYVLSQYDFRRTMKFVTFSGEEEGLLGSRAYADYLYRNDTDILVEFNADMIGRATTYESGHSLGLSITEDAGWIADIICNISNNYDFNFNITRSGPMDRFATRGGSDYYHFILYGYESISFWPGEWDPNMHKPTDDLRNINISYLVNMTRHIVGTMATLGDEEIPVPRISIANPKHGKIYYKDTLIKNFRLDKTIVINKILIRPEVIVGNTPIIKVEYYYDDKLQHIDWEKPYIWWLNETSIRRHKIKVIAYDENGNSSTDEIRFFYWNILKNR